MEKDILIQLTNNLYRLTLFFPKKEPLRYKMRELAADILANFLKNNPFEKKEDGLLQAKKDLEALSGFFDVALAQNWASSSQILALKQGYDNLQEELKDEKIFENKTKPIQFQPAQSEPIQLKEASPAKSQAVFNGASQRQEKIMDFLKENGRAQVWQIKEILPDVTKRTLRRDFEHMLSQGLIERIGERNETFYQIKTQ